MNVRDKDLQAGENKVFIDSEGEQLAALVYTPDGYDGGQQYPAIVVTPPATGVKEQTAGLYAQHMSQRGFIAIAFDPRGWGESEGTRYWVNPFRIIEDARTCVSYLRSLAAVDNNEVFAIGICMGAGFSAVAMAYDSRVKALAVVSAYVDASDNLFNALGAAGLREEVGLPLSASARDRRFQYGEDNFFKSVPETESEISEQEDQVILQMRDYYLPGQAGETLNWNNRTHWLSFESLYSFSVFHHTRMFDAIPSFHAYGDIAASRPGSERFYEEVNGPKERMIIEGAGHFDLYWRPEFVVPISNRIDEFFSTLDV